MSGRCDVEEQWLVMALRAARTVAVDKTELKSLRWQIFETSHSSRGRPAKTTEHVGAIDGLDEVLTTVKLEAELPGVVKVEDAKRWMRSYGERGAKAATLLGKLSSDRNGMAHPLVRQLVEEVRQLKHTRPKHHGDAASGIGGMADKIAGARSSMGTPVTVAVDGVGGSGTNSTMAGDAQDCSAPVKKKDAADSLPLPPPVEGWRRMQWKAENAQTCVNVAGGVDAGSGGGPQVRPPSTPPPGWSGPLPPPSPPPPPPPHATLHTKSIR